MPKAEFFRQFGLFVAPGFLDAVVCARLRTDVRGSAQIPGTIGLQGAAYGVDDRIRRVAMADVSEAPTDLVRRRALALMPDLERHFGVALADFQLPQFLRYATGDFYRRHRDQSGHAEATSSAARRVSIVIFLNTCTPEPAAESYGGGALTFYSLLAGPQGEDVGFPLDADEGLLVGFPADLPHSVEPVTHGERFTVAGWYV